MLVTVSLNEKLYPADRNFISNTVQNYHLFGYLKANTQRRLYHTKCQIDGIVNVPYFSGNLVIVKESRVMALEAEIF